MYKAFLIKYAEIGVKGKNRDLFEEALVRQIKYALKRCEENSGYVEREDVSILMYYRMIMTMKKPSTT